MIDQKDKAFAWSCFLAGCEYAWKRERRIYGGSRDIPPEQLSDWRAQFEVEWHADQ